MKKLFSWLRVAYAASAILLLCIPASCQPGAKQIGQDLYAYISDNDSSANSTFLVGDKGILVVDTGLNAAEASKLLGAIRKVSTLPVKFIVNTHYHPDHQGGNAVVGPEALVISTDFTRERTLVLTKAPEMKDFHFQPADLTFQQKMTLYIGSHPAEIYFSGKAHTSGDALVYFPDQKAISMGDLFLNRSSPAMDDGSANNWIQILDHVLDLPVTTAVAGHFELGTRADLTRFRDYLRDLYGQVEALRKKGVNVEEVRREIHMEKYSDFRQYPKYEATFSDNAATIYRQLDSRQ